MLMSSLKKIRSYAAQQCLSIQTELFKKLFSVLNGSVFKMLKKHKRDQNCLSALEFLK